MKQSPKRLTPKEIAAHYDHIADHFKADRSTTIGIAYVDRFCGLLPSSATVLDIGCGTGVPITKRLVENHFTVHALDLSERMISLAKQNVEGATFFLDDITTWEPSVTYDGAVAWDSIFHLTVENQLKVLDHIVQILKPQGIGLITCGVHEGEVNSSMWGQEFYYSSPSLSRYLELIKGFNCAICFSEVDDPTNGGHAVVCFQKVK